MNVLLDHCVPRPFGRWLVGHAVSTARQVGMDKLSNGKLLAAAAAKFDVLLTVDRSLSSQQPLAALPLPVIVLVSISNRIDDLAPLAPEVLKLLRQPLQKRVYVVKHPDLS